jgi:hypothetical protein
MMIDNWQGPGIYEHYKGGHYIAIGLVRLEWNGGQGVAYMTLDPERQRDRFYENVMFTVRPLNEDDGEDCWNSMVERDGEQVPRFKKVA